MKSDLLLALGIKYPIIQAPMGGGPATPALAAAVSNAGALGSLAGGYLTPGQITDDVESARKLTAGPLNINLFAGGYQREIDRDASPILDLLGEIYDSLRLPPPRLADVGPDPFPDQVSAVLKVRPRVFSFTFGIPTAETMKRLRSEGILTLGTATTPEEAEMLEDSGIDGIVAQGAEAGAHRGTFAGPFELAMIPTLDLVRKISSRIATPVIASGGIMTGADIAAALHAGASAVQLGTAFLACSEAGTSEPYRNALLRCTTDRTVVTRAYSGRAARGLRNRFIDMVGERDELILPYPIQNSLTRPMRAAAAKANNAELLSLWAGTGVARIRAMPAADLVQTLMQELVDAAPELRFAGTSSSTP